MKDEPMNVVKEEECFVRGPVAFVVGLEGERRKKGKRPKATVCGL